MVFNVQDYGAVPNSSGAASANDTDIAAAVADAIAAVGGMVYFPSGEWFISAAITIAQNGTPIAVVGNGVAVTTITQTTNNTNAFTVTQASREDQVSFRDMTVRHNIGSTLSTGVGIYVSNSVNAANDVVPNSIFNRLYIGNAAGSVSAFTYGLQLRNQKVCFISDVAYCGTNANTGTGILLEASGASLPGQKCIGVYISNCNIGLCGTGIRIKDSLEGCYISNTVLVGLQYGIDTDYMIDLGVFNSHINASVNCIRSSGTGGAVDQFSFTGTLFYAASASVECLYGEFTRGTINSIFICPSHDAGTGAINITSGSGVNVTGCTFYNLASYAVKFGAGTSQCAVTEMTYSGTAPTDYVIDAGSDNRCGNSIGLTTTLTVVTPATTVSFNFDITKAFLGAKANGMAVQVTSDQAVAAQYNWDDAANSKINAVIKLFRYDGANVGAASYRITVALVPSNS